jgi:hypothetical protein
METYRGIVHGRMIELDCEPGLPDGEAVTIVVQTNNSSAKEATSHKSVPRERRAFGAWADDARELDEYLAWNRKQRGIGRAEEEQ